LTRPSRDTVIVSERSPRRSTTLVFDSPHPMPIGSNTISGLDTSSATPWDLGPGQRSMGLQESPVQRSIRRLSAAITARLRLVCMTAKLRATAIAVETSCAAAFTAIQSRRPPRRGKVMAVTIATIASTTAISASVIPRRMARIKGWPCLRAASESCGEKHENAKTAA